MVKRENKYPRTIAATLRFLQYHNLRGKHHSIPNRELGSKQKGGELVFINNEDEEKRDGPPEDDKPESNRVS